MINVNDLRMIARGRLADADVLYRANRHDAALYLCGYAVELALKARICRTLKWKAFPEVDSEFKSLTTFRTHDLAMLLRLSGAESKVRSNMIAGWTQLSRWVPEMRYRKIGMTSAEEASNMIEAARQILRLL